MAPPVGSLVVRVGSDIRGLTRGMKKGADVVNRFGNAAGKVATRIALLTTATAAAGLAIGVKLTRDGLKAIDSMAKFARVVGISTEALAGLQLAAQETADFTGQQFNLALQRMTRRIAEAAQGSGEAKAAIEELGLSAKELAQAGPDEAFLLIADAMQNVTEQSDRLRLGFKLFDSEGARLVNTLAAGRAEIEGFGKLAEELGLTFSEFDARQVEAANDAMGRIGAVIQGISRQLAIELSPFIKEFADRLSGAARESGGFGDAIKKGLGLAIRVGSRLVGVFRQIEIGVKSARLAFLKSKGAFSFDLQDIETTIRARIEIREVANEINALIDVQRGAAAATENFLNSIVDGAEAGREAVKELGASLDVGDPLGQLSFSGEGDPEIEALVEKVEKRLEIIREGLLSESEVEREAFFNKMAELEAGHALELLSDEEFQAQREDLEKQHQDRIKGIEETAADQRAAEEERRKRERIRNVTTQFDAIASLTGTLNRTLFENSKAGAIAEAVVLGIAGAMRTWNAYPYPWNILPTAAHIAGTAAQVAQINASSFSGGGGAAAVPAGPSGGGAAPTGGGGGGGGGGGQSVNISLVGETFGRTQVRDLIEEINDAVADGARLRIV